MKKTKELLPNLIVLTFPKTGSTSLHAAFSKHPEICLPNAKETWFFDQYWNKGIEWYKRRYLHCSGQKIRCDFVSTLMYEKGFSKKLLQAVPEAKFIVLLRDPIARCVSHHFHDVRAGLESKSLQSSLSSEVAKINECSDLPLYRETGALYKLRICELLSEFPRKQLRFVLLEEIISLPDCLDSLCKFLGVAPIIKQLPRKNVARKPRNYVLRRLLSLPKGLFQVFQQNPLLHRIIPLKVKYKTRNIRGRITECLSEWSELSYKKVGKLAIADEINQELAAYYNEKLAGLDKIIEKDLSIFWKWFKSGI